jgi:hypothetical protein
MAYKVLNPRGIPKLHNSVKVPIISVYIDADNSVELYEDDEISGKPSAMGSAAWAAFISKGFIKEI